MSTRSESAIKREIINNAKRRLGASYYGSGSMLDGLASDISVQVAQLEAKQEQTLRDIHFNTISEDQISRYCEDFNIRRRTGRKARVSMLDYCVLISTTNGRSISEMAAVNNIDLLGLTLMAGPNKKYFITEIEPNGYFQSSAYVGVQAYGIGSEYNIAKNQLTSFEKNYTGLVVTNTKAIVNGESPESTSALRTRIVEKIESNSNTQFMLESSIAKIPGLGKSTVVKNYDGPGSLMVCIQPFSGVVYPQSTIEEIQQRLEVEIGAGRKVLVKNYSPVGFVFETTMSAKTGFSAANLIDPVKSAIADYFNGLGGGSPVSLSSLVSTVKSAVPGIKSLGLGTDSFDSVVYTVYEGSARFETIASPNETILIEDTQIATLGSPDSSAAIIINVIE